MVVVYSFTIYEAVLKKVECRVDVGSMWSWKENIYNKMKRRRENNKIEGKYLNCCGGNKKLRENIKIVEEGIQE